MNNFTYNGDFNNVAVGAALAVEGVSGFLANTFVLSITLYQRKSWKQSSTIFFTSLILANFVMVLLHFPFAVTALAAGEWIFGSTDEEKTGTCTFAALTFWYSSIVIILTLAAISFDRFLFIVKPHLHKQFMRPWVALTLTIAIWTLSAVLSSTPFYGLGNFSFDELLGFCFPLWISVDFIVYSLVIILLLFSVIIVTSVWTLCFTHRFITQQSQLSNDDTYGSKKKWLLGIFGSMLLVYGICFMPAVIAIILIPVIEVPIALVISSIICSLFITVANPIVQSCFRPEIKSAFLSLFKKPSPFVSV
uniref:G-protein coupled receptors family 1 profile domain-containing protein n=2 Tax=Amphimedon queenslandica TaxID=400682 RepID=A0A1X7TTL6_AMPQE